jgi:hypothetical protein
MMALTEMAIAMVMIIVMIGAVMMHMKVALKEMTITMAMVIAMTMLMMMALKEMTIATAIDDGAEGDDDSDGN